MATKLRTVLAGVLLSLCAANSLAIDLPNRRENREPTLTDAINAAIVGRRPLDDFTITARWDGHGSVTLWGEGLGLVDQKTHFVIEREPLIALMKSLRKANFVTLPEELGDKPPPGLARQTVGAVALLVGNQKHQKHMVVQFSGDVNKELEKLAKETIATANEAVKKTKLPASLAEALEALATGELPPRAFRMMLSTTPTDMREGQMFNLQGRQLSFRTRTKLGWAGVETKRLLTAAQWIELIELLREQKVATWPATIQAESYTTLNVGVLNHAVSVQARQQNAGKESPDETVRHQLKKVVDHLATLAPVPETTK